MNLSKLFEMQKELDDHIIKEKHLEGQDLLPNKILALQVELGELANEWRGFKHWSNDKKPRRERMLEEYVDCLHFILSIGLDSEVPYEHRHVIRVMPVHKKDVIEHLITSFKCVQRLYESRGAWYDWDVMMANFRGLGEVLGFTWNEIEQAYMSKNAVNHQRQVDGY